MPAGGLELSQVLQGRSFMGGPAFPTWLTDFLDEVKSKKECERPLASGPGAETGANQSMPTPEQVS